MPGDTYPGQGALRLTLYTPPFPPTVIGPLSLVIASASVLGG